MVWLVFLMVFCGSWFTRGFCVVVMGSFSGVSFLGFSFLVLFGFVSLLVSFLSSFFLVLFPWFFFSLVLPQPCRQLRGVSPHTPFSYYSSYYYWVIAIPLLLLLFLLLLGNRRFYPIVIYCSCDCYSSYYYY